MIERKQCGSICNYYLGICLERPKKNMCNCSQGNQSFDRDMGSVGLQSDEPPLDHDVRRYSVKSVCRIAEVFFCLLFKSRNIFRNNNMPHVNKYCS
jgi:hypothetical protein